MLLSLLVPVLLRWTVGLHPYSGMDKPPMFGDYEAQRHWAELTIHLPVTEWYRNSTENDLQYWGLDYPPLTAYHMYVCGLLSRYFEPASVRLHVSRGYQSYHHKLFMRASVVLSDLAILFPAAFWYFTLHRKQTVAKLTRKVELFLFLIYPGLILIDHGHFQYNGVSLGLTIAALAAICTGRDCIAALFFSFAINYKQMELYHSLPFFCYLLGRCWLKPTWIGRIRHLLALSLTVFLSFGVIWLPFLLRPETIPDVISRVFPVTRGLFEDKVANIWCALSVVYKVKSVAQSLMFKICLLSTALAALPSCVDLVIRPSPCRLNLALINSALAFFLFSFHVHEKTILLAAMPVALTLGRDPYLNGLFLYISSFSMLPLLLRDGLLVAYLALIVFHITSIVLALKQCQAERIGFSLKLILAGSVVGSLFLSGLLLLAPVPTRLPDLYPLLIAVYSCGHFVFFLIYYNYKQFTMKDTTAMNIHHNQPSNVKLKTN